jgi:hypothetical protein
MHAVVYTAIFGDYDTLKQPAAQDQSSEFVCFTDAKLPSSTKGWHVVHVTADRKLHPRMQAKQFKLLSHKVFPNGRAADSFASSALRRPADISIWIDGSVQIRSSSFVRDLRAALGEQDWAMFSHPDRDCIYDEAQVCAAMFKYHGLPLFLQVEAYRSTVPPHGGLYACTVIVRREPAPEGLKAVNSLWWEENLRWTYQDQLSLPYVLRQMRQCEPIPIPGNLWSNKWFDLMPHNADT